MKKLIIAVVLAFVLPIFCVAQNAAKQDIAKVDVLVNKKFNGANMSVFGVFLGMKKADAKAMLAANSSLIVTNDEWNTKSTEDNDTKELRLYIYDVNAATGDKGNCILYLIWNDGSTGIDRITIFNDFKSIAKGNTQKLFSSDVIDASSDFYKKYLGKPTKNKLGDYTNTYFYKSKNIEIIEYKDDKKGNSYYFALTKIAN